MQRLEKAHAEGAFERLIVVAPPVLLGDLRAHMSRGLQSILAASIDKDLTHLPDEDIRRGRKRCRRCW